MKEWPRLIRDTTGLRARSVVRIANGLGELPPGTLFTIERSFRWNELNIKSDGCRCCGMGLYVRKVPRVNLELV